MVEHILTVASTSTGIDTGEVDLIVAPAAGAYVHLALRRATQVGHLEGELNAPLAALPLIN